MKTEKELKAIERLKAFEPDRMIAEYPKKENISWQSGLDVFKWWIGEDPNQINLFDE